MDSNEEYLDSLLKNMLEEETPQRNFPEEFAQLRMDGETEEEALQSSGQETSREGSSQETSENRINQEFSAQDISDMLDQLDLDAIDAEVLGSPEEGILEAEEPVDLESQLHEEPLAQEEPLLQEEPLIQEEPLLQEKDLSLGATGGQAADDPGRKMSAEEIEAMFAALEAEDSADSSEGDSSLDDVMAQMQDDPIDFFAQEETGDGGAEEGPVEEGKEEADYGIGEDMMALLNSVSEADASAQETDSGEFDFFGMDQEQSPAQEESGGMDDEMAALLGGSEHDMPDIGMDLAQLLEHAEEEAASQEEPVQDQKEARAKRKRKPRKEKPTEQEKADQKPGLLSRLFTALTGDDEEEEFQNSGSIDGYNMDAENQSLLEELGEVSLKQPSVKKAKKEKKPKKEKIPKEKKPKKEKTEREKKPREPKKKEPAVPEKKGRPLPKKRVAAISFMGLTILAALLLFNLYLPNVMEGRQAMAAYAGKNYEEAFYLLTGRELKGEEKDTYQRTVLILQMQRQLESYENYLEMDMQLEALNALVRGVDKYEKSKEAAERYGVQSEVNAVYLDIMSILQSEYGLTEDGVQDILSQKDDVYYTIRLKQVLGEPVPGLDEADTDAGGETQAASETEPDLLPEEELITP